MAESVTPRLVATDLDGTILRTDGTVSARTVAALRDAEARGLTVVLVTGRPPRWMGPVVEALGHTGLAVCANGALVLDLHHGDPGTVVAEQTIEVAVLTEVVAALRRVEPTLAFGVEYADGFVHESTYQPGATAVGPTVPRPVDLDALLSRPAVKLLAKHPDGDPDVLLQMAREVLGDVVEMTHSSRDGALLEISAVGVSKASALAALCAERGLGADEVVAFGDMPNDLPMLAWAGTSYAMANAHRDVLAAVPRHAPSNDDDGVAVILERFLR
ncbi:MAG TPA: HAD family hydrolase [Actinomycetes bacterium]|nr:HAD family hydrolase [Actinomycetes bacterium]